MIDLIETTSDILVLAAHPDDETLGMGGTIHKLARKGVNVHLLTFTDGESARREKRINRRAKLSDVVDVLGIAKYVSLNFDDNAMDSVPLLEICCAIEDNLQFFEVGFTVVFTHHAECLNIDHKILHQAALTVFRPFKKTTILSYYVPSSSDYSTTITHPNFFVPLDEEDLQAKMDAASLYNSEMRDSPHSRSYANLIYRAQMNGSIVGEKYAEGFRFERGVIA